MLALDNEASGWTPSDGPKEDMADHVSKFLQSKEAMLQEYFGLEIDEVSLLWLGLVRGFNVGAHIKRQNLYFWCKKRGMADLEKRSVGLKKRNASSTEIPPCLATNISFCPYL